MALCIPLGLGANRITSVVFVDEDIIASVGNLTQQTQKQHRLKKYNADAVHYPISLLITAGLEKGQQYSLGTGPLTLHSKKENMGNQMRARRLCW